MSTRPLVSLATTSAQMHCMRVLPSPVEAKMAARPRRRAHVTRSRWKGKARAGMSWSPGRPVATWWASLELTKLS